MYWWFLFHDGIVTFISYLAFFLIFKSLFDLYYYSSTVVTLVPTQKWHFPPPIYEISIHFNFTKVILDFSK
jgi:hypothetical protein